MNERIKLLAEQAREYATTRHPVSNTTLSVNSDLFEQKFAELIIKRCRDIVSDTRDLAIEEEWNVDEAMSTAMFDIEDYFGV